MSISLDIALYLRDHGKEFKGLSAADRGVLLTLAFRIGTKIYTWISQKMLAEELCIDESNLRKHLNKLIKFGLIVSSKNDKDSRRIQYRPADFLHDYNQNSRNSNINYQAKSPDNQKFTRRNHLVSCRDTGRNHLVNFESTGRNHPVIFSPNDMQDIDNKDENHGSESRKVTYKSKVTLKAKKHKEDTRKKHSLILCPPNFLSEELWQEFIEHRKSIKSPMTELAQKKAFKTLEKMKEEGQNIEDVINNSIVNGWKGLFPIKEYGNGNAKYDGRVGENGERELSQFEYLLELSGGETIYGTKIGLPRQV